MLNPFQINQNGAKERSESDLGSKFVPGFQKRGTIFEKRVPQVDRNGVPNRPKWCPGALQKRSRKQVGQNYDRQHLPEPRFVNFLAPLGRFWASFGAQLGAKGVPKSSIWASRRAQSRKNSLQEDV